MSPANASKASALKASKLERPPNVYRDIETGINNVLSVVNKPVDLLNTGFAKATNFIANAMPPFPAATMYSMALGVPHAHVLHPPSGPLPLPPIPLPPFGPIMFGNCVQVLINGKPAARCGDLGIGPTCCGLPPIYEVFTGSSNVFIGGARAARMLDITYHCKPVPPAGTAARGAAAALKTAMAVGMGVMTAAGLTAQACSAMGDIVEAEQTEDPAMSQALALSGQMKGLQMASDVAGIAAGVMMGKDICVPPGTPGAIIGGTSPNVLIGGFPMPSWMNVAKGLLKLVKGLCKRLKNKNKGKNKTSGGDEGPSVCPIK
jgi:uncharacterized Zn-binding protein involved in type VI secretion